MKSAWSARNLLRRKGRTALTLVGVVIGTCMVVLMISLGIAQTKTNEEMLQSWGDLTQVQIYGYGTMVGQRRQAAVSGRRGHRQHQADPPRGGGHALRAGV